MNDQPPWHEDSSNIACLFSFPFPVYVDTQARILPTELRFEYKTVRVYPFFRSGPANFGAAPAIDAAQVPQQPNAPYTLNTREPCYLPVATAIPALRGEPAASAVLTVSPKWEQPLRFFPMDSIRLDLLGSAPTPSGVASQLLNRLLLQLRVLTRQWWIGLEYPTGSEYYLRHIFSTSRSGRLRGSPESYHAFTTPRGDELPVDNEIWRKAIDNVQQNKFIADYQALLLDARYHNAKNEMRRAIIDLAVACEQACEVTFIRIIEQQQKPGFRRGKYYSGNDLTKHLNQDLKKICGCALSEHKPELNQHIARLWQLRGDLAHGRPQNISKEEVSILITATEGCVGWLENICGKVE